MSKKLTKKQLEEIKNRAYAEELRAGYVQQADDVIIGMATHCPQYMDLFLMVLFGENRNKVAEISFNTNTAKLLIDKLQKFVNENEGGKNG
jgi:hypothetical protein